MSEKINQIGIKFQRHHKKTPKQTDLFFNLRNFNLRNQVPVYRRKRKMASSIHDKYHDGFIIDDTCPLNSDRFGRKPIKISEKMSQFIERIYLGPLYITTEAGYVEVGNRVQEYIYFLDPADVLYQITSYNELNLILGYYHNVNKILTSGSNGKGINDPVQMENYFSDELRRIGPSADEPIFPWTHKIRKIIGFNSEPHIIPSSELCEEFDRASQNLGHLIFKSENLLEEYPETYDPEAPFVRLEFESGSTIKSALKS